MSPYRKANVLFPPTEFLSRAAIRLSLTVLYLAGFRPACALLLSKSIAQIPKDENLAVLAQPSPPLSPAAITLTKQQLHGAFSQRNFEVRRGFDIKRLLDVDKMHRRLYA
jgi:hypothetical protein